MLTFDVRIGEPKPNKMFTEWQTAITKFLIYSKPIPCAHCGKKKRGLWTQLKFFRVMEEEGFALRASDKLYAPLTPVCEDHILQPDMTPIPADKRRG